MWHILSRSQVFEIIIFDQEVFRLLFILLILYFIDRGGAEEIVVGIIVLLFKTSAHIAEMVPHIEKDLVGRSHLRSLKL